MEKTLQAKALTKVYNKNKKALDGVDVVFRPGCIYGLIGRNGAGKTTLLSCLTAQANPTQGEITYGGEKVWENAAVLGEICFAREMSPILFMGPNTYKVKDYLRAARMYYPHWDEAYAKRLVEQFGLEPKKRINALSKGMLSMLTIVLAMASMAPITILDEPVAGLDVVAREQFYKLLLEDYENTQRTFIVSTHILEEAATIFEEVVLLDKGKILEQGNTEELVSQFHYVSGKKEDVEQAVKGMKVLSQETMGKTKGVVVRCGAEQLEILQQNTTVDISPMNLQKVFIALTTSNCKEA